MVYQEVQELLMVEEVSISCPAQGLAPGIALWKRVSRQEGTRGAQDSPLPRLLSPMLGARMGCNDISPRHCSEPAWLCGTQTCWQGAAPCEPLPAERNPTEIRAKLAARSTSSGACHLLPRRTQNAAWGRFCPRGRGLSSWGPPRAGRGGHSLCCRQQLMGEGTGWKASAHFSRPGGYEAETHPLG